MEAVAHLKTREQICRKYKITGVCTQDCECPLNKEKSKLLTCKGFERHHPEQAVEIVDTWLSEKYLMD